MKEPRMLYSREWVLPTRQLPARDLYVTAGGRHSVSARYHVVYPHHDTCALVYVLAGEGRIRYGRREHLAGPETIFALIAGRDIAYWTDPQKLWRFLWVGFRGQQAVNLLQRAGLTPAHPVLNGVGLHELRSHFVELHLLGSESGPGVACATLGKLWMILGALIDRYSSLRQQPHLDRPHEFDLTTRVSRYLIDHLAEPITLARLAREFHVSPYHLVRLFRKEMGQSPIDYLIDERIRAAQRFLLDQDKSIAEVARSVSYQDAAYFSRLFKQRTALSPRQFRDRQH